MSSDSDRRACVTTWTDEPRLEWLILTLPRYAQAPNSAPPARGSAGLAHRGHVEPLHPHRRHRGPVEIVSPLARQGGHRGAHLEEPSEHSDRRLVEPEVVH